MRDNHIDWRSESARCFVCGTVYRRDRKVDRTTERYTQTAPRDGLVDASLCTSLCYSFHHAGFDQTKRTNSGHANMMLVRISTWSTDTNHMADCRFSETQDTTRTTFKWHIGLSIKRIVLSTNKCMLVENIRKVEQLRMTTKTNEPK